MSRRGVAAIPSARASTWLYARAEIAAKKRSIKTARRFQRDRLRTASSTAFLALPSRRGRLTCPKIHYLLCRFRLERCNLTLCRGRGLTASRAHDSVGRAKPKAHKRVLGCEQIAHGVLQRPSGRRPLSTRSREPATPSLPAFASAFSYIIRLGAKSSANSSLSIALRALPVAPMPRLLGARPAHRYACIVER